MCGAGSCFAPGGSVRLLLQMVTPSGSKGAAVVILVPASSQPLPADLKIKTAAPSSRVE